MLTPFQSRALRALVESPFFQAVSEDCMRWVHRTSLRKGEILFEKNTPSDALFGVVSGQMKLYSAGDDGRQISFGLVGPGELVGAIGISNGAPRHASAIALAHCELATLKQRDLAPLMERFPILRDALAYASAEAARQLSERIEDAAFLSIEARVEKALLDFAQRFGEHIAEGICVQLRQQDLADVLGLSRESVSRVLTSPAMRGRVKLGRGRIILLGA
jgi:CRP/FNR family cyclic AMP-dependent transcriptional regulator